MSTNNNTNYNGNKYEEYMIQAYFGLVAIPLDVPLKYFYKILHK